MLHLMHISWTRARVCVYVRNLIVFFIHPILTYLKSFRSLVYRCSCIENWAKWHTNHNGRCITRPYVCVWKIRFLMEILMLYNRFPIFIDVKSIFCINELSNSTHTCNFIAFDDSKYFSKSHNCFQNAKERFFTFEVVYRWKTLILCVFPSNQSNTIFFRHPLKCPKAICINRNGQKF